MCAQTVYKKFSIGEADNIEAVKALRDAGLYMPVFDATLTPLLDAPHSIVSTDGADEHEAPEGADEDEAEAEAPGAGPLNPPLAAPTAAQARCQMRRRRSRHRVCSKSPTRRKETP